MTLWPPHLGEDYLQLLLYPEARVVVSEARVISRTPSVDKTQVAARSQDALPADPSEYRNRLPYANGPPMPAAREGGRIN